VEKIIWTDRVKKKYYTEARRKGTSYILLFHSNHDYDAKKQRSSNNTKHERRPPEDGQTIV